MIENLGGGLEGGGGSGFKLPAPLGPNKACLKKTNPHRLPITTSLALEWSIWWVKFFHTKKKQRLPQEDKGACSPKSNKWGADDEAPEEQRPKKDMRRTE